MFRGGRLYCKSLSVELRFTPLKKAMPATPPGGAGRCAEPPPGVMTAGPGGPLPAALQRLLAQDDAPAVRLALAANPSLDPDIADKVRKLLRRIQLERGIAILYTSHNMRDIEEVCDRVLFMHTGKVVAEGSPAEVIAKFDETTMEQVFIRIVRGGDPENRSAPVPVGD